jgi:hypothetical protein
MYPQSIFPKLFGLVTLEVIIWAIFSCYFIIVFYEYFLDKHITPKLYTPKLKYLILVLAIIFILFLAILFTHPDSFRIPYFYLGWGIILLAIPFLLQLFEYPKTTSKLFMAAAYFFYLHFIYEITALKLGWWVFPGPYFIGMVSIFGVSFPIEELLFWFILFALGVLTFFEYFDNNEK